MKPEGKRDTGREACGQDHFSRLIASAAPAIGLIDMRAQADVPSARRSDTPKQLGRGVQARPHFAARAPL
jgi:hypothetical protein